MINPATQPQDELNEFTWNVKNFFRPDNEYGRNHYSVRLRNGTLVRPEFKVAEDETEEDVFLTRDAEGRFYCWNLDGTSVTRRDYDMMEIIDLTAKTRRPL